MHRRNGDGHILGTEQGLHSHQDLLRQSLLNLRSLREKSDQFQNLINEQYEMVIDNGEIAAAPKDLYLSMDEFNSYSGKFKGCVVMNTLKTSDEELDQSISLEVKHIPSLVGNIDAFSEQVLKWQEEENKVLVVAPTKGQVRRIHELLHEWGLEIDVDLGRISEGFQLKNFKQVFIAEHEIFGRTHKHRYRRKPRSQSFQRGLNHSGFAFHSRGRRPKPSKSKYLHISNL